MRVDQLTFTRFLAAIAIVIFHYGHETFLFNHRLFSPFFRQANVGVSYFFILSGFVMIIAYWNDRKISPFQYYRNRIARIYPLYLLALLAVVFERLVVGIYVAPGEFILNAFALQSFIPSFSASMNFTGWTLSVEFFFYALFPLLINTIYKSLSLKGLFVFTAVIWILSQTAFYFLLLSHQANPQTISYELVHHFPLMHLNEFIVGNFAGLAFFKLKGMKTIIGKDIVVVFLVLILSLLLVFPLPVGYHNGFLAIVFVPLIISLSQNRGVISKVFNLKLCKKLGELSYGIYILQYPVHMYAGIAFAKAGIPFNFYVYVLILIVASYLAHTLVEVPAKNSIMKMKLKKHILRPL